MTWRSYRISNVKATLPEAGSEEKIKQWQSGEPEFFLDK